MATPAEQGPPIDLSQVAAEPTHESVRRERDAAPDGGDGAADSGGLVSPDHAQSAPDDEGD